MYYKLSKIKNLKRIFDVIEWLYVILCECIFYVIFYNMFVCVMNFRLFVNIRCLIFRLVFILYVIMK